MGQEDDHGLTSEVIKEKGNQGTWRGKQAHAQAIRNKQRYEVGNKYT